MNDMTPRKIKTGGDPRMLPDYVALRDELSKLTHPARPDVNWLYVEKLCLSLFEQNGVELQTAAWYTLARMQLAGLFGLNEGLTILEALISHQWGGLWPQPVHARMEILSSLSQRLQQRMRSLPLNYSDLSQLYQAEQLLTSLGEVLQRLELKHLSQLDALRTLMHNSAVRLENSDNTTSTGPNIQSGIVLPATVMNGAAAATRDLAGGDTPESAVKWVYVAQPEHQPNVEVLAVMPAPVKKWKSFAAGMCTMLVISAAAVWGWQYLHRTDPLLTHLAASLAPLPVPLTPEQLDMLRQQSPSAQTVIAQTQQQIARLDKLPPDWNLAYSRKLTEQAQALWPEQAKPLAQQWQQQINISVLPVDTINGWHEGMTQLQALADKLNALDGQRGKYITVSELKSQVFGMLISFRRTVPVEEQLRQLKLLPEDSLQRQQQVQQAEQHLRAQISTLAQEKQRD
ncbi:VasL domain-containing protein [Erwinia persicina]|uniref:Type VI secretion system ImpA family N-terminal domain-containing protein n=1 Tax=Erwinia persicina TaxID=55211 RepID=A0ABR8ZQP1_9GAMM|nr:VasL domain-containing protein [Erwinia persicina]MBD8105820.1 type VI secretion system ImpA family N-terminal domain-containing protein [Erwinia persicina]MBD8209414.1 type VI secretion system ImpA family N-terminal domain-containing protein [Erwinia persicina]